MFFLVVGEIFRRYALPFIIITIVLTLGAGTIAEVAPAFLGRKECAEPPPQAEARLCSVNSNTAIT